MSLENPGYFEDSFTDLMKTSAQQMMAEAIEAERREFVLRYRDRLEEHFPSLHLRGIISSDMADVLRVLVGDAQARGFSAGVVSHLKQVWDEEY